MRSASQLAAALWRSKTFRSIDATVTSDQEYQLFLQIISRIVQEIHAALEDLPGSTAFPDYFSPQLESILHRAYRWNRIAKTEILKYDFEPYAVKAFSEWDLLQMEPFSRLRSAIPPHRQVISSVSLGLMCCVTLGDARASLVQQKALVVVEECFLSASRARTISAGTPRSVVSTRYNPPRFIISQQPSAHPDMSIYISPSSNGPPPPTEKKSLFCCY
jgi:hypothetical protein